MARHPLDALGDIPKALEDLGLPAFAANRQGTLVWLNPAAIELVGDITGLPRTTPFAPESKRVVDEAFARKVIGNVTSTDYAAVVLTREGRRLPVEVSSVRVEREGAVSGIFGVVEPDPSHKPGDCSPHLTPRQAEVLMLLAQGASTDQIAEELGVTRETVRNHVRDVLRRLDSHSRLEAVLTARRLGLV